MHVVVDMRCQPDHVRHTCLVRELFRRPHPRRRGLPLLPVQDRQRRDHGPRLRVAAERHLQLRPQRLRLPRPVAGGLRQRLLPEPAGRQGAPGLRSGALLRHEVPRHGQLLRVQPGRLLRRLRGGDDKAREDRGQDARHRRRDTPGLPVPELVTTS